MNKKNKKLDLFKSPILQKQDLSCPHFKDCSGCEVSVNVNNPPILSEAKAYFAKKGVSLPKLITGKIHAWRFRAKLVVRGTSKKLNIGLYKRGTHDVLDIPFCKVHHPNINYALTLIKDFIKQNEIEPYDEITKKGTLRYLQLAVQRESGKVQVTFVLNKKCEEDLKKWELPEAELWHSTWLNFNQTKTNTIFGLDWAHVNGPSLLFEKFGQTHVCFHPASFAQSNPDLFEKMLDSIKQLVPENAKVVEYYAGVGVIGLKIASKCQSIICSEIIPQAEICFTEAKKKLPKDLADKISFRVGPSENELFLMENKDLVIVDPPRKGLTPPLVKGISENKTLKKMIYVSCGWKAFQRDCDYFLNSGWQIEHVEAYLFFPGSNHLEILALFKKE